MVVGSIQRLQYADRLYQYTLHILSNDFLAVENPLENAPIMNWILVCSEILDLDLLDPV